MLDARMLVLVPGAGIAQAAAEWVSNFPTRLVALPSYYLSLTSKAKIQKNKIKQNLLRI